MSTPESLSFHLTDSKISEPGNTPTTPMSTAVTIYDASQYFDEHGFLYRPLELVGTKVKNLYEEKRLRDETANFGFFKPFLESDPVSVASRFQIFIC